MGSLLFQKMNLKGLELKNRIVMPPMANGKAKSNGHVSEDILDFYRQRAENGLGLVIVEHCFVNERGKAHEGQLGIHDDHVMEGLIALAKTIKETGSLAVAQISHAGSQVTSDEAHDTPLSASAVLHPVMEEAPLPEKMSLQEIQDLVEDFRKAAIRAKKAGFDGVEIHGAHGYLLNQFYSPLTNQRDDEYGGSRKSRLALSLEITAQIRHAVGKDYPVLYRLGAVDGIKEGLVLEDGVYAAMRLEKEGIDLLDVSGGMKGSRAGRSGAGYFEFASSAVKEKVSVPVLVTGGITEPKEAERILENKSADLIGVGRALLKDPFWAKKARSELED